MEDCIITMALATRLKRRVFAAKGIRVTAEKIVRKQSKELNVDVLDVKFEDYGMILTLSNKDRISSNDIAFFIRNATSGPLRHEYPELAKMPSLWTRAYFCENGYTTASMLEQIQEYYNHIKTR